MYLADNSLLVVTRTDRQTDRSTSTQLSHRHAVVYKRGRDSSVCTEISSGAVMPRSPDVLQLLPRPRGGLAASTGFIKFAEIYAHTHTHTQCQDYFDMQQHVKLDLHWFTVIAQPTYSLCRPARDIAERPSLEVAPTTLAICFLLYNYELLL